VAGVLSLGSADLFKLSDKKARITLTRLKPENDLPDGTLALQYWPESVSDTKATNWANKAIPGGNLPLYSWINGAERVISFSTIFATDVDVTKWTADPTASQADDTFLGELKQKGLDTRNIDIRGALLWLRSFLMPTYNADGTYLPPPKCEMVIPGSRLGYGAGGTSSNPDGIISIMTQCDIDYRAFFPNGVPRIASVSLSFAQLPQWLGIVKFPGYSSVFSGLVKDGADGVAPYKIGKV
jgi:hypothetical protein